MLATHPGAFPGDIPPKLSDASSEAAVRYAQQYATNVHPEAAPSLAKARLSYAHALHPLPSLPRRLPPPPLLPPLPAVPLFARLLLLCVLLPHPCPPTSPPIPSLPSPVQGAPRAVGVEVECDAASGAWLAPNVALLSLKTGHLLLVQLRFEGQTVSKIQARGQREDTGGGGPGGGEVIDLASSTHPCGACSDSLPPSPPPPSLRPAPPFSSRRSAWRAAAPLPAAPAA